MIIEYPLRQSDSGPYGITEGVIGEIWFTQMNGNRIGKLTADGTIYEYDLSNKGSQSDDSIA